MRTIRTLLALVLTVALIGVAPAAAKPGKPKPPPEPEPTLACDTVAFLAAGSGGLTLECDWTPENTGATLGTLTVEAIDGSFSYLAIVVRDSAPGDYCYLANWDKPSETSYTASFDLVRDGSSYWASTGNWCGEREDLNGAPLTITVSTRVKRGTQVVVNLDPAQS